MASERNEPNERERRPEQAREQDESYKRHGDKLDPVIPRGADQRDDADEERITRRSGRDDER